LTKRPRLTDRGGGARTEPFVKFMLQKLEAAGCKVEKDFINHKECEKEVLGGFMVPNGVRPCVSIL